MKSRNLLTAVIASTFAVSTAGATPISVAARDAYDTGGGGSNQHNQASWNGGGATETKPTHSVETVTTTGKSTNPGDGATPQTFEYNVVDTNTGTDFNFTITVRAMDNDGGTYADATKRNGGVKTAGTKDGRDFIEHTSDADTNEYFRTTFDTGSIVINSGPQVYFTGWNSAFIKVSTVSGAIRQAGTTNAPSTSTDLATWTVIDGEDLLELALATDHTVPSIDWIATTDSATPNRGFKAFGFILNFDTEDPGSGPGPRSGFIMTDVTFDGTTATATWNSKPNQFYYFYFSSDLINWVELDDSFASQGTSTTYTDNIEARFSTMNSPQATPTDGYYRAEENND